MKNIVRRIAVVVGAAALSVGLIGVTSTPAHADDKPTTSLMKDTSWPF